MVRTGTVTLAALTFAFLVATAIALAQAPTNAGPLVSPVVIDMISNAK